MKKKLEEMLREFIERDFTIREMSSVLTDLESVETQKKVIEIYRKHEAYDEVLLHKEDLQTALDNAAQTLSSYALDYNVEELI